MIDAKDFLNEDDAGFGFAGRIGAVGAELETVGSGQCEGLTQCDPPLIWSQVIVGPAAYRRLRPCSTYL
jgi:hypothetical protein